MVNEVGCSRVVENLPTIFSATYATAAKKNFTDSEGNVAGWTKAAGRGAGNVAFVSFAHAGHMLGRTVLDKTERADNLFQVPHDDPVAALTMFSRWLNDEPLA